MKPVVLRDARHRKDAMQRLAGPEFMPLLLDDPSAEWTAIGAQSV